MRSNDNSGRSEQEPQRKPKNLHIARRKSPNELTSLMLEQYNLQRQLEQVQAQQKQILQQQQISQQFSYPYQPSEFLPPTASFRAGHSRSSSMNSNSGEMGGGHRRTGSASNNPMGHQRRQSLGLNEAMRAAANQKQSNYANSNPKPNMSPSTPPTPSGHDSDTPTNFRFPASSSMEGSDNDSNGSSSPSKQDHNRARSFAYGPQSFKFPQDGMTPPNISVSHSPDRSGDRSHGGSAGAHQRRGSHYRTGSRNTDLNGGPGNINSNWRQQQRPASSLIGQEATGAGGGLNPEGNHGFGQLEPPSTHVLGHRQRNSSFGGSVSSISQFNPQGNAHGRKSLFAPYLPQSSLPELISEGKLVTGTLRVNKKNRSDAYVSTDGLLDADIFICGSKDRNRALEGDYVAVELLSVDEVWEAKREKEAKKRRKDNSMNKSNEESQHYNSTTNANGGDESHEGDNNLGRRGSLKQRPTMKKNDDLEVEGQSLLLVEEEEINDDVKPLYAGHVVAVIDRIRGQLFTGTLGLLRPNQAAQAANDIKSGKEPSVSIPKSPNIVWFKPTDKKVPLVAIQTDLAPPDFVENHEKYADQLFVAAIKRWPITSLHPFGTLLGKLGSIDDRETEIDSILRDNNFMCDEYPDEVTNELPSIQEELSNPARTSYVNEYTIAFTETGKFVDKALHVKRISNQKIEIGFHVSDISFFIAPWSRYDKKAGRRSASVFLPQKTVHLYPDDVNQAASFAENTENLAISVVFEIDTSSFEIEDLKVLESVVSPKKVVSFDDFDQILAGNAVGDISSATSDYVKTFGLIAKEFRRQRLEDDSLGVEPNLTLLNQIDDEKVRLSLNIFDQSVALDIIQELSIKVNTTIAAKIHASLGDQAFLRRQPLPTLLKMEAFVKKAVNLGVKIDTSTSATLQKSVLKIEDLTKRQCIETILFKCMPKGAYFVAGKQDPDSCGHYYFNLPIYTHFTTPLKDYSVLIVHRQLKSVLQNKKGEQVDLNALKASADYCNFKKECAAHAQEQAIHLEVSQTINELSEGAGHLLCMGTVVQIYESSFDVFLPDFGVEKRVHCDQLPLVKAEFDKIKRILSLYWEKDIDSATYIPPDEKSSLSYRSSIKNKFRSSSVEAASLQRKKSLQKDDPAIESIQERLAKMKLKVPDVKIPSMETETKQEKDVTKSTPSSPTKFSFPKNARTNSSSVIESDTLGMESTSTIKPYLQTTVTSVVDGDKFVQEIKELSKVPILLKAEIGKDLPCLTVRTLNPFA